MAKRAHTRTERTRPALLHRPPDDDEKAERLPPLGGFRIIPGAVDARSAKPTTGLALTTTQALREALMLDEEGSTPPDVSFMLAAIARSLEALPVYDVLVFIARLREITQEHWVRPASMAHAERSPPLPRKAPLLWSKRDRSLRLSPVAFTRMTYGPWLGKGLTRSRLRELDKGLYHALANWISRHPDDAMPELPSQSEQLDQKVARLAEEFTPDELRRLGLALQARLKRSGN